VVYARNDGDDDGMYITQGQIGIDVTVNLLSSFREMASCMYHVFFIDINYLSQILFSTVSDSFRTAFQGS